jgi:hypothetical protein
MIKNILIFLTILIAGCSKSNMEDITSEVEFPSLLMSVCFDKEISEGQDEFIFRTEEEFENYAESIKLELLGGGCDTVSLPSIDFDNYTLIAKYTTGGGCEVERRRKVYQADENDSYIYEIKERYKGGCHMLIMNMNWAVVPRIPEGYTVEFEVK